MATLPESIGRLGELRFLSLGDNLLVTLPQEFAKLTKLSKLELYNNRLGGGGDGVDGVDVVDGGLDGGVDGVSDASAMAFRTASPTRSRLMM